MKHAEISKGLARGGAADLMGLAQDVALPTLAKGVLRRRPGVVGLLESSGTEARGIRRLQHLRQKYGNRAILVSVLGRKQLIVTDPAQALYVLKNTPDLFKSSSDEKSAALAHFEPGVSLISDGAERQIRRDFNAEVLEEGCPMHSLAGKLRRIVELEFGELLSVLDRKDGSFLTWDDFEFSWNRMIRSLLLGDGARDDVELTNMLNKLRDTGNWAFLHPKRKKLRARFYRRLQAHLDRAEPNSLAGLAALFPNDQQTQPADQFTHYMFAFDPGGMATFRALALLASHRSVLRDVRAQMGEGKADPLLRASILESLRLWSTTPVILRQARDDIDWNGDTLPAHTQVIIYAPLFHRDDKSLPEADSFCPDLWPEGRVLRDSRFFPFSEGDGICPARDLVLITGATVLMEVLGTRNAYLYDPSRLDPAAPLPPTLDNYTLAFRLERV